MNLCCQGAPNEINVQNRNLKYEIDQLKISVDT